MAVAILSNSSVRSKSVTPSVRITVNASAFAVPAYRRLGFVPLGPAQLRDGLVVTPMAFTLPAG